MSKKPRAYSYLRFSTPEQLKGDSMRRQTQLAEDYARKHGLTLDTELNLKDLGVSAFRGANVETGALGAFLEAVKERIVEPGSLLLVESLDRVSRKVARKAVRILEDIVEAGVTVVTLNDGKQYTAESLDGFDFVMAVLILIRANEESATKARRLKAAWFGKRQRAKSSSLTAIVPGWIKLDAERKTVLIPERASIVRQMVRDYLRGIGKHSIVKALNEGSVPPFGRAKQWHRSYIDKILTSPALIGTFIPHIETHESGKKVRVPQPPVEGYYPAVIDVDAYARLQAVNGKSPLRGRHAGRALRNLLSGLAKCPKCGSTMTRVTKGSRGKAGQPFLVCTRAKEGAGCTYRVVPYAAVEKVIASNVEAILADMPHADVEIAKELRGADVAVDRLAEKVEDLLSLVERRPSDALAGRLVELEGKLKEAQKDREEIATRAAVTESKVLTLKANNLTVAMRARPINRQRINAALRELLESVVIDYAHASLEFHWRSGGASSIMYAWPKESRKRA